MTKWFTWFLAGLASTIAAGAAFFELTNTNRSSALNIWLAVLGATIALASAFLLPILGRIWSSYRRRQLNVRTSTAGSDDADDNYNDELLSASQYRSPEEYRLALYRRQGHEAENELSPYLPANPRRAKRLINHQRLYARIAEDRGVFGGEPELTHLHLAKWVLIIEEWPRLGAALTLDPSKIEALEKPSTLSVLKESIAGIAAGIPVTDELRKVLHNEISLSPIFARLVRFEAPKKE